MLPRRKEPRPPRRRMYVAFAVAGENLVLPAAAVAGVAVLGSVTRLPTRDPACLGLTTHQGRIVALVAPAGFAAGDLLPAASHLVVLRGGDGRRALAVEEPIGIKAAYGDELPAGFALLEDGPAERVRSAVRLETGT